MKQYIGIPFVAHGRKRDGVDCWGLVVIVYRDQMKIDLPSYESQYHGMTDLKRRAFSMNAHMGDEFEEVGSPLEGDCVVVRFRGMPLHVGIFAGSRGGHNYMLHTTDAREHSFLELLGSKTISHAKISYHRHKTIVRERQLVRDFLTPLLESD